MRPSSTWLCRVLALLVGLVIVPASLAVVRPDDRGGQQGPGAVSAVVAPSPNARDALIGVGKVSAISQPQANFSGERDAGLFRSDGSVVDPLAPTVVEQPIGTDWGAILTGVGLVAVLALATAGVVQATRHHGGPAKPVAH
jgi:hypothetical protein